MHEHTTFSYANASNETCGDYTAIGYGDVCCFGAYYRNVSNNILHPVIVLIGFFLSFLSYRVLDQTIQTSTGKIVYKKYWQPAYYLLKAISLNGGLFFITVIPAILYQCTSTNFCGTHTGAKGYALVSVAWSMALLGNEAAHWCTYTLVVFYGIERCLMLNHSPRFNLKTSRHVHFLAIQLGFLKGSITAYQFYVEKNIRNNDWEIATAESAFTRAPFSVDLIQDCISLAIIGMAVICYGYICHRLIVKPVTPRNAIRYRKHSAFLSKRERRLTAIYIFIASLYMVEVFFTTGMSLVNLYLHLNPGDSYVYCDVYEIMTDVSNLLLEVAELSSASMGFLIGRQMNGEYLNRLFTALLSKKHSIASSSSGGNINFAKLVPKSSLTNK